MDSEVVKEGPQVVNSPRSGTTPAWQDADEGWSCYLPTEIYPGLGFIILKIHSFSDYS